ncbi:MAG TPA: ABC transporter permease [Gemmataceae bacterium]|nr:ABC transporter permease [Gemmataceae bacterium]
MRAKNILHLGVKELWSLARDPMMLVLIVYAFTLSIYSIASGLPDTLHQAPIAIVDEDQSPLSQRIVNAFQPPLFLPPKLVSREEMDARMDAGLDTFALNIPPKFQEDVLAGRSPAIQLNTDATRVGQAFSGSSYVQTIVHGEVQTWLQRYRTSFIAPVDVEERLRYNPNLSRSWFGAVVALMDQITMLSVLLTGAALIRERERGTVEHLLVMPVTPFEIMTSKIWSMGLVVLVASAVSLTIVVQGVLSVPVQGSVALFLCGAALHLFAATSLGMFLATFARTMPQFALLMILVLLPLLMLSGGMTPRESMPEVVQQIMLGAPTTHFVMLAQGILFRGAGLTVVWPQFLALALIGATLFNIALVRFRKTIGSMA